MTNQITVISLPTLFARGVLSARHGSIRPLPAARTLCPSSMAQFFAEPVNAARWLSRQPI